MIIKRIYNDVESKDIPSITACYVENIKMIIPAKMRLDLLYIKGKN